MQVGERQVVGSQLYQPRPFGMSAAGGGGGAEERRKVGSRQGAGDPGGCTRLQGWGRPDGGATAGRLGGGWGCLLPRPACETRDDDQGAHQPAGGPLAASDFMHADSLPRLPLACGHASYRH